MECCRRKPLVEELSGSRVHVGLIHYLRQSPGPSATSLLFPQTSSSRGRVISERLSLSPLISLSAFIASFFPALSASVHKFFQWFISNSRCWFLSKRPLYSSKVDLRLAINSSSWEQRLSISATLLSHFIRSKAMH